MVFFPDWKKSVQISMFPSPGENPAYGVFPLPVARTCCEGHWRWEPCCAPGSSSPLLHCAVPCPGLRPYPARASPACAAVLAFLQNTDKVRFLCNGQIEQLMPHQTGKITTLVQKNIPVDSSLCLQKAFSLKRSLEKNSVIFTSDATDNATKREENCFCFSLATCQSKEPRYSLTLTFSLSVASPGLLNNKTHS